jgi:hypothetical protein
MPSLNASPLLAQRASEGAPGGLRRLIPRSVSTRTFTATSS